MHTVKIDRALVSRVSDDPSDALIVRSVIELGHGRGLQTVAGGVEDVETRDLLVRHWCDVAQGLLFGRPIPAGRGGHPTRPSRPTLPARPADHERPGRPVGPVPAELLAAGSS